MTHPDFVEPLWLIRNGMREETALGLDEIARKAAVIVFGQFEGGKWNWDLMEWEQPRG